MTAVQVLKEMEKKLDELIENAHLLKDCDEENGECSQLEHQQEMLLNALLKMNSSLEDNEKQLLLQKSPDLYSAVEQKLFKLSRANYKLLKCSKVQYVRKARVHKRRIKKPPTQLSMDLN